MFIQPLIHRAGIDIHIRVLSLDRVDPLGGRYQYHKLDIFAAPLFHLVDGGD